MKTPPKYKKKGKKIQVELLTTSAVISQEKHVEKTDSHLRFWHPDKRSIGVSLRYLANKSWHKYSAYKQLFSALVNLI